MLFVRTNLASKVVEIPPRGTNLLPVDTPCCKLYPELPPDKITATPGKHEIGPVIHRPYIHHTRQSLLFDHNMEYIADRSGT